jgi:hypothetical protein
LFQTCFHFFDRHALYFNGPYVLCSLMLLYIQILKIILIKSGIFILNTYHFSKCCPMLSRHTDIRVPSNKLRFSKENLRYFTLYYSQGFIVTAHLMLDGALGQ